MLPLSHRGFSGGLRENDRIVILSGSSAAAHPPRPDYSAVSDSIARQDPEILNREDELSGLSRGSDQRGEPLHREGIDGHVQLDFAGVAFVNGNRQAIDHSERNHRRSVYSLLDFKDDGRKVGPVRVIAKSRQEDAKFALLLRKEPRTPAGRRLRRRRAWYRPRR